MEKNQIKIRKGFYKNGEVWEEEQTRGTVIIFNLASKIAFKMITPNPLSDDFEGEIYFDLVPGPLLQNDEGIFREFADPHVPFGRIK